MKSTFSTFALLAFMLKYCHLCLNHFPILSLLQIFIVFRLLTDHPRYDHMWTLTLIGSCFSSITKIEICHWLPSYFICIYLSIYNSLFPKEFVDWFFLTNKTFSCPSGQYGLCRVIVPLLCRLVQIQGWVNIYL